MHAQLRGLRRPQYYRTALKLARHFKGKDHPSVGVFLTNLGDIYRKCVNRCTSLAPR